MYQDITIKSSFVLLRDGENKFSISLHTYKRAIRGRERSLKLRNPQEKQIGGMLLVFTANEWKKVRREKSRQSMHQFIKGQIHENAMKCPKLAKQRNERLITAANTFKARELENKHIRNKPALNLPSRDPRHGRMVSPT